MCLYQLIDMSTPTNSPFLTSKINETGSVKYHVPVLLKRGFPFLLFYLFLSIIWYVWSLNKYSYIFVVAFFALSLVFLLLIDYFSEQQAKMMINDMTPCSLRNSLNSKHCDKYVTRKVRSILGVL